jgi:hypothetical protein
MMIGVHFFCNVHPIPYFSSIAPCVDCLTRQCFSHIRSEICLWKKPQSPGLLILKVFFKISSTPRLVFAYLGDNSKLVPVGVGSVGRVSDVLKVDSLSHNFCLLFNLLISGSFCGFYEN